MDHFNAIPYFIAVVDYKGFSAAAEALGISKSAISKRITQLEAHLGVRLLHRTTRKISLTEAGSRYYDYAAQANLAAQNAEDAVSQLQGEPQGKLKINAPMSFGLIHMAGLIPEFLLRYPKISIDLVMDDKAVDLVEHGFDVAIRNGELEDSSLIARRLAPIHSIVCASPAYIDQYPELAASAQSSPELLSTHNCLLYSYSTNKDHWQFHKEGKEINVRVEGSYRVNNSEALKQAVLKGLGIGRLPTFVAGDAIREGTLVNLFPDYRMPAKKVFAIYPERDYLPAKVRAFLDFAIEYFGEDYPYWDKDLFASKG
jgi:DNA-binding transcriptional LysR family regulator